ncbi:MAG: hypothetical protein ACR2GY_04090 [Phycisphaerales bacterium]
MDNHPLTPSPLHPLGEALPIEPKRSINIRLASMRDDYDMKNIDALHKANIDGLGYWQRGRFEGAIEQQRVLIAETIPPCCPDGKPVDGIRGSMLGFLIYTDKYSKREDVGCIYAVCVHEIRQRGLIGAALVQNAFERMPYSVKLCCCWCAQDLDAGYFWESLGFVPLAYRTGSEKRERIHIFWQKRIREGDVDTPWWYPSLTSGGAIGEGRLVLPMLPGMDWRDPKPMVLPEVPGVSMFKQLPGESAEDAAVRCDAQDEKDMWKDDAKALRDIIKLTPEQEVASKQGQPWFLTAEQEAAQAEYNMVQARRRKNSKKKAATKKKKAAKGKREYSEKYLQGARAICAMYLDRLHAAGPDALPSAGKYECSRSLESAMAASGISPAMLLAAFPGEHVKQLDGNREAADSHHDADDDADPCDIIDAEYMLHGDHDNHDEDESAQDWQQAA